MKKLVLLLLSMTMLFGLLGCEAKKFKLDLDGNDFAFEGQKKDYKVGEKVKIYYSLIATDTDYSFTVDGESFNPDYDNSKGYVFEFVMPSHDVKIEVSHRNSMMADPELATQTVCSFIDEIVGTPEPGASLSIEVVRFLGDLQMNVVNSDGETTETKSYVLSESVLEELEAAIEEYQMKKWSQMDNLDSLDGRRYAFTYYGPEGTVSVSTDRYPTDQEGAFSAVKKILLYYAVDESLINQ